MMSTPNIFIAGGFFKKMFENRDPWGFMIQFDDHIFRRGWLIQPPTSICATKRGPGDVVQMDLMGKSLRGS